jgi:predicted mannosyl-3-phosphoglycerate phosphatase (HAD superfamily)
MNLTELPKLIKAQALEVQRLSEQLEQSRWHKKLADIEIEKQVQTLDKKVCSNENQRDIARYDLRDAAYNSLLAAIVREESQLAAAKIELEYLKNEFEVAKISYENQ